MWNAVITSPVFIDVSFFTKIATSLCVKHTLSPSLQRNSKVWEQSIRLTEKMGVEWIIPEDLSEKIAVWLWSGESVLSHESHGQKTYRETTEHVWRPSVEARSERVPTSGRMSTKLQLYCSNGEESELSWCWKGRKDLDHAVYVVHPWAINMICLKF